MHALILINLVKLFDPPEKKIEKNREQKNENEGSEGVMINIGLWGEVC